MNRTIVALVAFVWPFSTMYFQMCPQSACIRRGIVTLVAFVWLFSTVRFQMSPQSACMRGWIFTLVAFVWFFFIHFLRLYSSKVLIHHHSDKCLPLCNTCCELIKYCLQKVIEEKLGQVTTIGYYDPNKIRNWNSCLW